jgi:hypothetical protein
VQFIVGDDGKVSVVAKKTGLRHLKGIFGGSGGPFDVNQAIADTVERRTATNRNEDDP